MKDSVVAKALTPQAYEVLTEVLVEVVGGVGVGYHDGESTLLKLAALKLLEPGGQPIATTQGNETFDESMPLGLCPRIRSFPAKEWGWVQPVSATQ